MAATVVLCLLAAAAIVDPRTREPRLYLDPSLDSLLPAEDAGRLFYQRIKGLFEGGETVLIALGNEDVFETEPLERVRRISERIEELDSVHHVSSLSTALNIRGEEGELRIRPFFDEVPEDAEGLADLRRRALSDPIYAGNLVSGDGRVALVSVQLLDLPERELIENGVDERIAAIVEEERGDAQVWITGGAHIKAELVRLMLHDLGFIVPICALVMGLVAFLSFRSFRGVAVPMATVGLSILWTLAFMALFYGTLNQVTVAAPPILLVVGLAYSVHVLSAYYDALRGGGDPDGAPAAAVRAVAIPVFFTGITTAAGFLSLATSPLEAIRQFGIFCGVGVIATLIVTLSFAPALLRLLPTPERLRALPARDDFDRRLEALARFDLRNRAAVLGAWGLFALIALVGMFRIDVGTDLVSNFKPDNRVRSDFDEFNRLLEGANGFQVVLETSVSDAFKDPENLHELDRLQEWLEEQPEVGGTTSVADYIKAIHQGFQDADPREFRVPDTRELVSQLLVIGSNEEMDRFVDTDFEVASVAVRTRAKGSANVMALVERIEERLGELPEHLRATVTGNTVLISRTMDDIALGQALSLGVAFAIIYGILVVLFTSFRVGFVALIPNALPVLVYFGILGWAGVTLNTTTGLVACLVLGIAVDDTIHLMAHFNTAAKSQADESKGIVTALRQVGRPVTYTTMALCAGFLCLIFSSMNGQIEFGWLAAVTLAVAWLVDVTFTPAIAGRMRIVTLWDVLTLDLGEAPHESIPLFAGLRETEARIAALLGSIRRLREGAQLFKTGDSGDEMYIVIEGVLVASVAGRSGDVVLREHQRGDIIGEVALFEGRRTADVHAKTAVRLLRLTLHDLERLKRRYPRIGAQLYANLSEVLAGRLASLTRRVIEKDSQVAENKSEKIY
jgi:predicted RND superfamily exporter protein